MRYSMFRRVYTLVILLFIVIIFIFIYFNSIYINIYKSFNIVCVSDGVYEVIVDKSNNNLVNNNSSFYYKGVIYSYKIIDINNDMFNKYSSILIKSSNLLRDRENGVIYIYSNKIKIFNVFKIIFK